MQAQAHSLTTVRVPWMLAITNLQVHEHAHSTPHRKEESVRLFHLLFLFSTSTSGCYFSFLAGVGWGGLWWWCYFS